MLHRYGFQSLKGVTFDLLGRVESHTGRVIRSSLRLELHEVATDRDDQLQDGGPMMWRRFEGQGRAVFDPSVRRYLLRSCTAEGERCPTTP